MGIGISLVASLLNIVLFFFNLAALRVLYPNFAVKNTARVMNGPSPYFSFITNSNRYGMNEGLRYSSFSNIKRLLFHQRGPHIPLALESQIERCGSIEMRCFVSLIINVTSGFPFTPKN